MKRFVIILFSLVFCFLIFPFSAAAEDFSDVKKEDWFYADVAEANRRGLMLGTGSGCFSPQGVVSNIQALTMLARIHSMTNGDGETFTQKTGDMWYTPYLDYLIAQGVLTEEKCEIYLQNAEEQISRRDLTVLFFTDPLLFFDQINEIADNAIPDVPMTAEHADVIYCCYRAGILTGTDDNGSFSPDRTVTRSQMAAIIVRIADPAYRVRVTLGNTVDTTSLTTMLNTTPLTPVKTGYTPFDTMADAVFAKVLTDKMTTAEKVGAVYDYLVSEMTYGSSPVSGVYRDIYKKNPYLDPVPDRKCKSVTALAGDRGYTYFDIAVQSHALEGYTVQYAAELLDGKKGVCDHYSSAFAVLMRYIGLDAVPVYVNSKLNDGYEPHMTVVITIAGTDFYFDPQIEQVVTNRTGKNEHKYFGKTIDELNGQFRDTDAIADCRALFGTFEYDYEKMNAIIQN